MENSIQATVLEENTQRGFSTPESDSDNKILGLNMMLKWDKTLKGLREGANILHVGGRCIRPDDSLW